MQFSSAKDPIKRMKQEATVCKKTTANHISEKGLVFRKYDELSRLKIKKAIQL